MNKTSLARIILFSLTLSGVHSSQLKARSAVCLMASGACFTAGVPIALLGWKMKVYKQNGAMYNGYKRSDPLLRLYNRMVVTGLVLNAAGALLLKKGL